MSAIPPPPPFTAVDSREVLTSRIIGSTFLVTLAIYVLIRGIDAAMPGVLLNLPLVVGAVISIIASTEVSGRIDAWGNSFETKMIASRVAPDKFSRWFKRPLYGGLASLWRVTRSIQYCHIRAWLRVSGLLYFAGLMIYLLIMAVYIIVAFIILGLILWLASKILRWDHETETKSVPFFSRAGRSVQREGLMGSYGERYDEHGKKTGESHVREGMLGRYVEHTDKGGAKIGESREREGLFEDYTDHTDREGHKVGESRAREGVLEGYEEHTDKDGKKVGESQMQKGLLENYVEHKQQ